MEWIDEAIIVGVRKYGETSVLLEAMTRHHGRHMGLVRGGRSRRMQPLLQLGNSTKLVWRARLDEHLGHFQVEPVKMRAAQLMQTSIGVHGIQAMSALLRFLPERDPHEGLYEIFQVIIDHFDRPVDAGELFVRFELSMLHELGFGLDLSKCAATGMQENLAYISPKSGRAVSAQAGEAWKDKLFKLPQFLQEGYSDAATFEELKNAFEVTNFFLDRHVYAPRAVKPSLSRHGFVQAVLKSLV